MLSASRSPDEPVRKKDHLSAAAFDRASVKLTWWKLLLFGGVTAAIFFVLLECMLALFGVKPGVYSGDPYVGFASNIPLYVKETGPDGQSYMVTASHKRVRFNVQKFLEQKPKGTYRIFCMGGSTTFGRPYDDKTSFCGWLRVFLPAADPMRRWELINAGGVSYASYRVALLMEELIRYDPDLFIIYSGHNEFLERRTYERVIEAPKILTGVGAILSHTRSYAATQKILAIVTHQRTGDATTVLRGEVDAILDHTIGPTAYSRDDEHLEQVFSHYRVNLDRMIDIARTGGARVVFITPASNLRDCSPFKSECRTGLSETDAQRTQTLSRQAKDAQSDGQLARALTSLDEALGIDDRYADLHFLRGRVLYDLGSYDQAKAAFLRAIDEDVCPLRAGTAIRHIVAEVAAQRNVPHVDGAQMIEGLADHGIPGSDYFPDHAHLTIEGYRLLALRLIQLLEHQNIVKIDGNWTDAAIASLADKVEGSIDKQAHGEALRNLALIFSWAGKLDEAERMAAQATELLGDDADALYVRGLRAIAQGDVDAEIGYYRQALHLKPDFLRVHYNLANALRSQDKLEEAAQHYRKTLELKFDSVEAHANLAGVLMEMGYFVEAAKHLRHVLRFAPDHADVHFNLANALRSQDKIDKAIGHYQEALRIQPDDAAAYYELGVTLDMAGQSDQALSRLREAARLDPESATILNTIAWILATHTEGTIRDSSEAIAVAQRAADASDHRDPAILDTLAAAYGAAGQFGRAVETAQDALTLATDSGAVELAVQIRSRLALYRQENPYRR